MDDGQHAEGDGVRKFADVEPRLALDLVEAVHERIAVHIQRAARLGDVEAAVEECLGGGSHLLVTEHLVDVADAELLHILLELAARHVLEHLDEQIFAVGMHLARVAEERAHAHRRDRLRIGTGDGGKSRDLAPDADARVHAQLLIEGLPQELPEFKGALLAVRKVHDGDAGAVHSDGEVALPEAAFDELGDLRKALVGHDVERETRALAQGVAGGKAEGGPLPALAQKNGAQVLLPVGKEGARVGARNEVGGELCRALRLLARTVEVRRHPFAAVFERKDRLLPLAGSEPDLHPRLFADVAQDARKFRLHVRHGIPLYFPYHGGLYHFFRKISRDFLSSVPRIPHPCPRSRKFHPDFFPFSHPLIKMHIIFRFFCKWH